MRILVFSCLLVCGEVTQVDAQPPSEGIRGNIVIQDPTGDNAETMTPPVATSGTFEIDKIELQRQLVTDALKTVNLNSLNLSFWFAQRDIELPEHVLVHIHDLSLIEDDRGVRLLSDEQLKYAHYVKEPRPTGMIKSARGKSGPIVSLRLSDPARNASVIRSVKGKVTISGIGMEHIELTDLSKLKGGLIDDERLKDFPIRAKVELENGGTTVKLFLPEKHDQLEFFGLYRDDRPIRPNGGNMSGEDGMATSTITYAGDQTKNTFLGIILRKQIEPKTIDFEFTNIPIP